jgi:hypothetical protein
MIRFFDVMIGPFQFAIVIEISPASAIFLTVVAGVLLYLWIT